jgi:putative transposase
MRLMGLWAIYPKRNLSKKHPGHKIYPYLLRDRKITHPNQVWATDITYIRLRQGFVYLVAVLDWYSRYVLSWRISNTLDVAFCREALEEALKKGIPEIFNSDQGSQFTSDEFTGILLNKEIAISMDGRGRAFDNIFTERLWRSVKYEEVYKKIIRFVVKRVRVLRNILYFITRGGTTNRWNIKHRMKFILEFLQ